MILNWEEKQAIIVDVTVPFEGNIDALKEAREAKLKIYIEILPHGSKPHLSECICGGSSWLVGPSKPAGAEETKNWKKLLSIVQKAVCYLGHYREFQHLEEPLYRLSSYM